MKEPSYRSQLCQHATATQLHYVMIAYAIPGGLIKRIVLIKFNSTQLSSLLQYQGILQSKYLNEFYREQSDTEMQL